MSGKLKRERFGRYLILDHLVDGGMAKICRARFLGEQVDRIVAIKMVQPQYSKNESFKSMFMDEIKVTFSLLHPNIVQTYDYGIQNEQLYVAMEYCDGRNLKEYLDKLKKKKFVFPVEISVYIITQACQGLHFAHTYVDRLTGKPAKIIHRDISPHNIMLTYDGALKVIDFGIAKAESNSESTQAGTIKGKISYLAPEYLEGLELDHRYDQFSIGITLWEMLTSRKLFKATNDLAILKKVQECKVPPPSKINPNVPKELDEIVLKALSKDRNCRYKNMDQLNRVLIKFLYANYPDFNSSDLSYFAKELFKEEIKKDRAKLFEFGKIDIEPYIKEWKNDQGNKKKEVTKISKDEESERKIEAEIDFGFENKNKKLSEQDIKKEIPRTISATPIDRTDVSNFEPPSESMILEEGTRAINDTNHDVGKNSRYLSRTEVMELEEQELEELRNEKNERNGKIIVALVVSITVLFVYVNEFIEGGVKGFFIEKKPIVVQTTAKDKAPQIVKKEIMSEVKIINFDRHKQKLYINGKLVRPDVLGSIKLPMGKKYTMRVEMLSHLPYVGFYQINDENMEIVIPDLERAMFGYIGTSRNCISGKIKFYLFGEERVEDLPIKRRFGIPFPILGDGRRPASEPVKFKAYIIKLGSDIEREIEFKFSSSDEKIDICELL